MIIHMDVPPSFRKYTDGRQHLELKLEQGVTAAAAAVHAGIPEGEIGFVIVNNEKVDKEYVLKAGDTVRPYTHIVAG